MADTQEQNRSPTILDLIPSISEDPFDQSLVTDVRKLSLEERALLLPKVGIAYVKIQSLYRFMEDTIKADTRNREDDLRPAALVHQLNEIPFLYPPRLQINM